jgi:hypothetical protein
MTTQQTTLAQLNTARSQLTAFIISNTAQPGTPEWAALENVIQERDNLTVQINSIIAAAFQPDTPTLTAAVNDLTQKTQQLTQLQKTLNTIGQVIQIAGTVVQTAAAVLNIATGAGVI